ncbi:cytochrome P450 6k1 isoform X2 [Anabrus simplex]|uniref:cytochrome P450 6k1 isoform X2 n=1 Tax=Anabrus simplex TaxID=316456 RepID=UPI0035A30FEA
MKRKALCVALLLLYLLWNWLPLLLCLSVFLHFYFTRNNGYWRKRGVRYLEPAPVIGNLSPLLHVRVSPGQLFADIYNQGEGEPFIGCFIFDKPALVIRDLELIKRIVVKDFEHFHSRYTNTDASVDPVGARNLFVTRGQRWKFFRAHLSPNFTTTKLRAYLPLMSQCAEELTGYLKEVSADTRKPITIRDVMARAATDVITCCTLGIKSNTLRNKNAEFRKYGRKIFGFTTSRAFEILGHFLAPGLVKIGKFNFLQKETTAFFKQVVGEAVEFRKMNNVERGDLLDSLLNLRELVDRKKNIKPDKPNVPEIDVKDEDIVGQSAIFFGAGFETTSITLSFTLYEMAVNPRIQARLREEIASGVKEQGGSLTYEAINGMKYLDMVVSGMRFGLLSTKVLLVNVLSRFEVLPCEDTPRPVELSPFALFLSSVGGIPLVFKNIGSEMLAV